MANETIKPYETKMKKSYNNLLDEYTSIRAGRANPHVLDQLRVDYYGAPTAIQQVANVSVPEARMIMIQLSAAGKLNQIPHRNSLKTHRLLKSKTDAPLCALRNRQ